MYDYTKSILEEWVSTNFFCKVRKRSKHCCLMRWNNYEWLFNFIIENQITAMCIKVNLNKKRNLEGSFFTKTISILQSLFSLKLVVEF
jgi:hypothetical protein